jgi:hypothetical protein
MPSTRVPRRRAGLFSLEEIPNVGRRIAADFHRLGLHHPQSLVGRDPYALYDQLNELTGLRHDPCVLDTFIAAVRFMEGAPARPWWHYTASRKRVLARQSRASDDRHRAADGALPRAERIR